MSETATYKARCKKDCTASLQTNEAPRHIKKGQVETFVGVEPPTELFKVLYSEGTGTESEELEREILLAELKEYGGSIQHNAKLETIQKRIAEILTDKLLKHGVNSFGMELEEMRKAYQHLKLKAEANPPKNEQD